MKKIIGLVAAVALLAGASVASAASFTNVEFDNGDVTVQGTGGQTVNVKIRVVVPAGEVVEQLETDVLGDSLSPVCEAVGGSLGLQEGTHFVTRAVKLPPNTGTYTLQVKGSGIYGAFSAIDCINNNVGTASFAGALKTVASGSAPVAGNDQPSWLAALMAAIANLNKPAPAPTVSTACTTLAAKMVGAQYGVTNSANGKLQGFLIGEGYNIPLLQANQAPFGFWGSQTQSAVLVFKTANSCN